MSKKSCCWNFNGLRRRKFRISLQLIKEKRIRKNRALSSCSVLFPTKENYQTSSICSAVYGWTAPYSNVTHTAGMIHSIRDGSASRNTATCCVSNCLVFTAATRMRHQQQATEHTTLNMNWNTPAAFPKLHVITVPVCIDTSWNAQVKGCW